MGVNTFFVGVDDPGGWLVLDVARAGGEPIPALGRAAAARLSHDRGLATSVGFLRGYAWFVARKGRAPRRQSGSVLMQLVADSRPVATSTAIASLTPGARP